MPPSLSFELEKLFDPNSEEIVKDATLLFRDIASDAATKAASGIRPPQEDMARIDEPADGHTWHDTPDLKDAKALLDELG